MSLISHGMGLLFPTFAGAAVWITGIICFLAVSEGFLLARMATMDAAQKIENRTDYPVMLFSLIGFAVAVFLFVTLILFLNLYESKGCPISPGFPHSFC